MHGFLSSETAAAGRIRRLKAAGQVCITPLLSSVAEPFPVSRSGVALVTALQVINQGGTAGKMLICPAPFR